MFVNGEVKVLTLLEKDLQCVFHVWKLSIIPEMKAKILYWAKGDEKLRTFHSRDGQREGLFPTSSSKLVLIVLRK